MTATTLDKSFYTLTAYNNMENDKLLAREYVAVLEDIEKWRVVATNNLAYYGCTNIVYFKTKEGIITTYSLGITKPTIALLDINLDTRDSRNKEGLEVCQFFKENAPGTSVVVMSSLENIADEARKRGANFIIEKKNFVQDFEIFVQQYTKKNR